MALEKNKNDKTQQQPKKQGKPRKRFVPDPTGKLGIAKSIANRFGEEICEEEFFNK